MSRAHCTRKPWEEPRLPMGELVSKVAVSISRPALERAGYRCECCRRDSGLRVVSYSEVLYVLCPKCRTSDGIRQLLARQSALAT